MTKPKTPVPIEDRKPCPKCGVVHPGCSGHARTGKPCGNRPRKDGVACRMHGGSSKQALSAAAERRKAREAKLAAETFGLPREVDPHTALLEELHRTAGAVEWLGAVVADLKQNQVAWGQTRRKTGGEDHGTTYEARPNAFVTLWQSERKHLLEVSKACISAGIEERRVRIAEDSGKLLAGLVRSVLDRMLASVLSQMPLDEGLDATLRTIWGQSAVQIVPDEFRRLAEPTAGAFSTDAEERA